MGKKQLQESSSDKKVTLPAVTSIGSNCTEVVNNKQYVHCCDITVTHEDAKAFMVQWDEYTKANRFKNITVKVFI